MFVFADDADCRLPRSQTGYGSKLPTRYRILLNDPDYPQKVYYVWAICWSNNGSLYYLYRNKKIFVNFWSDEVGAPPSWWLERQARKRPLTHR